MKFYLCKEHGRFLFVGFIENGNREEYIIAGEKCMVWLVIPILYKYTKAGFSEVIIEEIVNGKSYIIKYIK